MIRINLLGDVLASAGGRKAAVSAEPAQVYGQAEGSARSSLPIAGVAVGLMFALLGVGYYLWLNQQVARAEETKVKLEAERQELEKYIRLEKTFREQKEALQKKREVMMGLKNAQSLPLYFMQEMANCIPDDVWFREVEQKANAITIKGESSSFEAINLFRLKLAEQTKWFEGVNYPTANRKGNIVEFTISFNLKNPSAEVAR